MQCVKAELHEKSGLDEQQMKVVECGVRWAVEARTKGRSEEQEQRQQEEQEQGRQEEQEQTIGQQQGKKVRFGGEEQPEETPAEVRTGRGSGGLVKGEMRGVGRTRPAEKAKEKVMEEKVSMKAKEEDSAAKGHSRGRGQRKTKTKKRNNRSGTEWRLTWGAGGSHPQAISDLAENEWKGEIAEGEQQHNEEKEDILRFLRGWPLDGQGRHERQEEPEEESEEKKLVAQECRSSRRSGRAARRRWTS